MSVAVAFVVVVFLSLQPPGGRATDLADLGLRFDTAGCPGLFELVASAGDCTHGPDPVPPDATAPEPQPPLPPPPTTPTGTCPDDDAGTMRIQVLYVRSETSPSRLSEYRGTIERVVSDTNDVYLNGAKDAGGYRALRLLREADCTVDIVEAAVTPAALDDFGVGVTELSAKGFSRPDRLYLAFYDADRICGIGELAATEDRSPASQHRRGPRHARVDRSCWNAHSAAHEVGHMLGAVLPSAPNTSGGGHCTDEWDLMCYSDPPDFPRMQISCLPPDDDRLDCGRDDYFSLDPAPGTHVAENWNIADSPFLVVEPTA